MWALGVTLAARAQQQFAEISARLADDAAASPSASITRKLLRAAQIR